MQTTSPGGVVIDDRQLEALLNAWPVARLATVGKSGQPHLVPVVFCLHQGAIYSPIDGKLKTGVRLRRLDNISQSPRVSLLLDDYRSDWSELWWVRLDAEAKAIEPDPPLAAALERSFRTKYPQYRTIDLHRSDPLYIRCRWQGVTAWAQGDLPEVLTNAVRWASAQRDSS